VLSIWSMIGRIAKEKEVYCSEAEIYSFTDVPTASPNLDQSTIEFISLRTLKFYKQS